MEETDNSGEMRKSGKDREADRCERGKGSFAWNEGKTRRGHCKIKVFLLKFGTCTICL